MYVKSQSSSNSKPNHLRRRRIGQIILTGLAVFLIGSGAYLLLLTRSPVIISSRPESLQVTEQQYQKDQTDYIKIEKLNLLVPIYPGDNASILEKGAWHRFPERGDPIKGGNFIVSAHRFQLGLTPQQTKARSPFYHLEAVKDGDQIQIYYQGNWYTYIVNKTYSVKPEAVEIEAPSTTAKLTLYSCSLGGQADGRIVVEAVPQGYTNE